MNPIMQIYIIFFQIRISFKHIKVQQQQQQQQLF